MFPTPVALIISNRVDTTARGLERLAEVRPSRLLVIADGPRPDRPGDVEACRAARAVIERVDWDCEITKNYSDVNLGRGRGPATSILGCSSRSRRRSSSKTTACRTRHSFPSARSSCSRHGRRAGSHSRGAYGVSVEPSTERHPMRGSRSRDHPGNRQTSDASTSQTLTQDCAAACGPQDLPRSAHWPVRMFDMTHFIPARALTGVTEPRAQR